MNRIVLSLVLLSLVAFGVSAGGRDEVGTTDPVAIRVLVRPDEGGNVQKYADLFTEQSGVVVEPDFVGWAEIHDKTISTLAAGGGGYDIVFIPSANMVEFTSTGDFLPLNDMIAGDASADRLESVVDLYTRNGDLLAMPWYSGGAHMVYNSEILAKAGVDPASILTWADFKKACQAVVKSGQVKYAYTPTAKYPGNFYYAWGSIVASGGEPFFNEAGKPVFQDFPYALKSLQLVQDGTKEGLFDPAAVAMDDYEALIQFGSGEIAFMMNSTWSATQAYRNTDLSKVTGKVGYILIPGWGNQNRSGGFLYAGGMGILAGSKHPEEAKAFLALLTGEDAQRHHAIEGANLPTRVALFEDIQINKAWAGYRELTAQLGYGSFLPQYSWFEEWRQDTAGTIQKTIMDEISPDEALAKLLKSAESLR